MHQLTIFRDFFSSFLLYMFLLLKKWQEGQQWTHMHALI